MKQLDELISEIKFRKVVEDVYLSGFPGDEDAIIAALTEISRHTKGDDIAASLFEELEFNVPLVWPENDSFSLLVFVHWPDGKLALVKITDIMNKNLWMILTRFCSERVTESIINEANIMLGHLLESWQYSLRMAQGVAIFESRDK